MSKYRVVHYINQFFAGIGGEENSYLEPEVHIGYVGPGIALEACFNDEVEIVATIVCGDSYFIENTEAAKKKIIDMVKLHSPDLFISGPAFNAERYGIACGTIANAVKNELNIPVLSSMYIENPAVKMFSNKILIAETGNTVATMRKSIPIFANLALKILKNKNIGLLEEDLYIQTENACIDLQKYEDNAFNDIEEATEKNIVESSLIEDDESWIFKSLPNWLRWIIALPVGIIYSLIAPIIFYISQNYMGYSQDSFISLSIKLTFSTFAFLFGIYQCVPKYKFKITNSFILIIFIMNIMQITRFIMYYEFELIPLVPTISSSIILIYVFIEIIKKSEEERIQKHLKDNS